MALFQDPDDGTTAKVNSGSKAIRVESVNAAGAALNKTYDGRFSAPVLITPATLTDGTNYWALYNSAGLGGKKLFVKLIDLVQTFYGTAAASRSAFKLSRFSGNAPTGVSAQTPSKLDTITDANTVAQLFTSDAAALAVTGIETSPFHVIGLANQVNAVIRNEIDFERELVLNPQQGIVIQANGVVVAGCSVLGSVRWSEGS